MDLPRVSDSAARQIIDATRLYREYLRTRSALRKLDGSMFWKKVGEYEYLAHRVARKCAYLGTRSPETEAKYAGFTKDKQQLQARVKSLKDTVDTAQRMNKAVRAGTVPTEVIDVLIALDEVGLGEHPLVVGSPALYAYSHSAGVRLESVAEDAKRHMHFLISAPGSQAATALRKFKESIKRATIEQRPLPMCDAVALEVAFHHEQLKRPAQPLGLEWLRDMGQAMRTIQRTPKYEQVVIGKTGRMAMMRTVDPKIFIGSQALTAVVTRMQKELVSQMLADDMVLSKIDDAIASTL